MPEQNTLLGGCYLFIKRYNGNFVTVRCGRCLANVAVILTRSVLYLKYQGEVFVRMSV